MHDMPIWFANHIAFLFFASLPLSKGFIVRGVVSPPVRYETGCDLDAIKLKNTPCLVRNGRCSFPIPCQRHSSSDGIGDFFMASPSHAMKNTIDDVVDIVI